MRTEVTGRRRLTIYIFLVPCKNIVREGYLFLFYLFINLFINSRSLLVIYSIYFCWSIIALWSSVSFCCSAKWISYTAALLLNLISPVWLFAIHGLQPARLLCSRKECWSGLPYPPPGDLLDPGVEPESLMSPALASGFFTTSATWEALKSVIHIHTFPPSGTTFLPHPTSLVILFLLTFNLKIFLNLHVIALQVQHESAISIHISPPSWASLSLPPIFHPCRSTQSTKLSSLCYIAASH